MSERDNIPKELGKSILEKMSDKSCKDIILPEENLAVSKLRQIYSTQLELHTTYRVISDDIFSASKLKW